MVEWSEFVSDHMMYIWLSIAALSVGGMYLASSRLPAGWLWTTALAVLVVPVTILVGSLVSLATVLLWDANSMRVFGQDIGSATAYLLEIGLEFATPVFFISAISTAFFRLRGRNAR